MGNTVKPDHQGQPEITGVEDQRRATTLDNGDGINSPLGKDRADDATLPGAGADKGPPQSS